MGQECFFIDFIPPPLWLAPNLVKPKNATSQIQCVMKCRKITLLMVFAMVPLGLWPMTSTSSANACEYANSNLEYIKSKIEDAVVAKDFGMAKYHAYKALNGIEKTRSNFLDCGCEGTIESLENVLTELKIATKTDSFKTSKKSLHLALENTMIGIKVLRVYEQENTSVYSNSMLVMNTKEALDNQNGMFLTHDGAVKQQVHNCLLGFESSLEKVVKEVDCNEARRFVNNIYEESRLILLNTELSPHKKEYHQRVKTLTQDALTQLDDCAVID
jgi:hypothetical protein